MDLFVATGVYPAVLLALSVGIGLLVRRASGDTLQWALVPGVGLTGAIVVTQLTTRTTFTAPLTPWVLVAAAVVGVVVGRHGVRARLRTVPRTDLLLAALAAAFVYAVCIAPVVLSGDVTLPGYLKDTTTGTHLLGAEHLVTDGSTYPSDPKTSDELQLVAYFDSNVYPSGGHTLLGGSGKVIGLSLLWAYAPFLAMLMALMAPSLFVVARQAGLRAGHAAAAAGLAGVPAITYGYVLQGSIKEIAFLPVLAVFLALTVTAPRWIGRGPAAVVPIAVAMAAGLAAIGVPAAAWFAVGVGVILVLALTEIRESRLEVRAAGTSVVVALGVLIVAALPVVASISTSFRSANAFNQGNAAAAADPGNLFGELDARQVFGIWLTPDHRVGPILGPELTFQLLGVAFVAVALGVLMLFRRRSFILVATLGGFGAVWWLLTTRGTIWTDAKLIVISAPFVVLLAVFGAADLARGGRRIGATALLAVLVYGVLYSDSLQYRHTNLLPADRYRELDSINERFASEGPALLTDFDEFALYSLRDVGSDGPAFAFDPPGIGLLKGGDTAVGYGQSVFLDDLPLSTVLRDPLLVLRRSPESDRPPVGFERVSRGAFYDVWRRNPRARDVIAHLGVRGRGSATAVPRCTDVRRLAGIARRAGVTSLAVSVQPDVVTRVAASGEKSPSWMGDESIDLNGPGRVRFRMDVPQTGEYRLWLRANVARPVNVLVDRQSIGSLGYQSSGETNYLSPLPVRLERGRRVIDVERGGGTLHPGDAQRTLFSRITIEPVSAARVETIPVDSWRALCSRRVDWIEVVRR